MKYCFIINPHAGKQGNADVLYEQIKTTCTEMGADFDLLLSEDMEVAEAFVQRNIGDGTEEVAFIACGGDGTLCKTVSYLMSLPDTARRNACIGVMPIGTGNDFVSNFKHKKKFLDVRAQLEGSTYDIDLLKCNDLYSVNMVNIGFDCHVVCKKEEIGRKKLLPRKFAYIFALILTLAKKPCVVFRRDGGEKKQLLLTTFANGAFCGGGFNSNPCASLTDGNIDCIAIKNIGRIKFLSLVGKYKNGEHLAEKFSKIVKHYKCRETTLTFDEETPVSVDGEIIRTEELHLSVSRRAFKIILPLGVRPLVAQTDEPVTVEV